MGSVQANVKDYNGQLRVSSPPARPVPGFCVSHNLGLDETPDAHQHFDIRD